jgi:hypothetical protein
MERELAEDTEVLAENLPQYHFVKHNFHIDWPQATAYVTT